MAVVACLGSQAIAYGMALTPPVLAVALAADYGIPPSAIGLYTTTLFLSALVSAATGGAIVKRFGAIRASQMSLLAGALGLALVAIPISAVGLLGAVAIGLGYGPMTPSGSHLLARLTTARNRPLVFSVKQTSIPLGGAIAGLLPPAIATGVGWQPAVLAMAAAGLVAALGLQAIRSAYDADRRPHEPLSLRVVGPVREVLANPDLRRIVVMSFAYAAVQSAFSAFFVTFLVERADLDLVSAGFVLTLGLVVAIFARIGWGAVAERVMSTPNALALIGVMMSACCLLSRAGSPAWSLPALLLLSATFGLSAVGWNGLYLAEIVRVTSAAASARATGGTLVFTFAGTTVMPAVFSLLVAVSGGYTAAFVAVALVPIPAVLAMLTWKAPKPVPLEAVDAAVVERSDAGG